jgi:hypothetical protein
MPEAIDELLEFDDEFPEPMNLEKIRPRELSCVVSSFVDVRLESSDLEDFSLPKKSFI